MNMLQVQVKKLQSDAMLPSYAYPWDAGMDVYAVEDTLVRKGKRTTVPTGIAMELPDGYVSLVWDKSGIAFKAGITTIGGVIDAGYRGEYLVGVVNLGDKDYLFKKGEKVAQVLIQPVARVEICEAASLKDSPRGDRGFGSTGT